MAAEHNRKRDRIRGKIYVNSYWQNVEENYGKMHSVKI